MRLLGTMQYTGTQSILRLLFMGAANLKVKGIYLNGKKYSVKIRIPIDLTNHYPKGKTHLQTPLGTSDYLEAIKKAVPILEQWRNDFKALRSGKRPPVGVLKTYPIGKDLISALGVQDLEGDAVDDRLMKEADRRAHEAAKKVGKTLTQAQILQLADRFYREEIRVEDVLNPAEIHLLMTKGHLKHDIRLSDALRIYLESHPNGEKKTIKDMSNYAIDGLIASQGDLILADPQLKLEGALKRQNLEGWIKEMVHTNGLTTGTANRRLNQVKAILKQVAIVRQIPNMGFIVDRLVVANLGKDAKVTHSPPPHELKSILETFKDDPLITLLVFLGCRIAEVTGLKVADLHLDEKHPYISIRPNEIRGLKTANSNRDIPVFGESLIALKRLVKAYSNDTYLLPQYAKQNGATNASQTLNKRLASKGFPKVTTHSFRHALKDLLRDSGCPESLMDEIQGHGSQTVSRSYGRGVGIEMKAKALAKAYKLIK